MVQDIMDSMKPLITGNEKLISAKERAEVKKHMSNDIDRINFIKHFRSEQLAIAVSKELTRKE